MQKADTNYTTTVPIHTMENEIIRLNQKGLTVIRSEILNDNIKLYAVTKFLKIGESKNR